MAQTFCFAENVKNRKMFTIKTRITTNLPRIFQKFISDN